MPSKDPSTATILSAAERAWLTYWQAKENRSSQSEFVRLLLLASLAELERVGSLNAVLAKQPFQPPEDIFSRQSKIIQAKVNSYEMKGEKPARTQRRRTA